MPLPPALSACMRAGARSHRAHAPAGAPLRPTGQALTPAPPPLPLVQGQYAPAPAPPEPAAAAAGGKAPARPGAVKGAPVKQEQQPQEPPARCTCTVGWCAWHRQSPLAWTPPNGHSGSGRPTTCPQSGLLPAVRSQLLGRHRMPPLPQTPPPDLPRLHAHERILFGLGFLVPICWVVGEAPSHALMAFTAPQAGAANGGVPREGPAGVARAPTAAPLQQRRSS
jgi:hypothetical protein